jgi:uncharacterized protein
VKRIVCDTNVIVSAVHFDGKPMDVLQKAIDGEIRLFYSQAILNETQRILRDKFGYRPARLTEITDILKTYGVEVTPQERLAAVPSDPDDNAIVEAAVAGNCEAIVTGDKDLLRLRSFRGIRMMSAGEFLQQERQR